MLSHFVAKSALKLCNGPRPNKQFHTIHTFSNSPNAPRRLNSKVTALVKTHARHDTLTEKRVTKILKCFTTSAGPCIKMPTRFILAYTFFAQTLVGKRLLYVSSSSISLSSSNLELSPRRSLPKGRDHLGDLGTFGRVHSDLEETWFSRLP